MIGNINDISISNLSTENRLKDYITVLLLIVRDISLLIKHKVDWELIRHQKQTQINKDNIRENIRQVDYDYKSGEKVMLNDHAA